jgi:hypothetical protein
VERSCPGKVCGLDLFLPRPNGRNDLLAQLRCSVYRILGIYI